MELSLDHIILPKDVTDGFYSTWHNYYGELFPSPVKPKYRPLSKIFAPEGDSITQSSPNLLLEEDQSCRLVEAQTIGLTLSQSVRVGDNIDEFIRNNRKEMCRSNSLNEIVVKELDDADIFAKFLRKDSEAHQMKAEGQEESLKSLVKLRSKSEMIRSRNRFSWCGANTIKFLSNLQGKKKSYECTLEQEQIQTENIIFEK